jgi:hypothetical protein
MTGGRAMMVDDKSETDKPDSDLVNLNDDAIGGWSKKLGVSEIALQAAVEKVGPRVEDVRRFLRK